MTEEERAALSRRRLMRLGLVAVPGAFAAACAAGPDPGTASGPGPAESAPVTPPQAPPALPPTPACADADDVTPEQTEGPYFTPGSPERADLREAGVVGTAFTVTGRVLDTRCRPVAGALLDFWQADGAGVYDNEGHRLRGHQFTGADGAYRLETVLPGRYPGRTRHIHVKVQARGGPVLTTQLYFPGEPGNARDRLFRRSLQVSRAGDEAGQIARFDFVLDMG